MEGEYRDEGVGDAEERRNGVEGGRRRRRGGEVW